MKKIILCLSFIILCFLFLSCSKSSTEKETEKELRNDWRNNIEYEGSFYVNENKKFLYAVDLGKITLWDNKGSGSVFQTVSFETFSDNAGDTPQIEDFNGDGNKDIRIVYLENNENNEIFYNLFLWNTKELKFYECREYRSLANPVSGENGEIFSVTDNGIFGKSEKKYTLDNNGELTLSEFKLENAESIAENIKNNLHIKGFIKNDGGSIEIDGNKCPVFIVCENGEDTAYIAYNENASWFADIGCVGAYKNVVANENAIFTGNYTGAFAPVEKCLCKKYNTETITVVSVSKISVNNQKAENYSIVVPDGKNIFALRCENRKWYLSENGKKYFCLDLSSGLLAETDIITVEN